MSELRQNIATKEWVVIAPERLKGGPLQTELNPPSTDFPIHSGKCPFCPANAGKFENVEIDALPHPEPNNELGSEWIVRCVENKYNVVEEDPGAPTAPVEFEPYGIYRRLEGRGNHELIIESPRHNADLSNMTPAEVAAALRLQIRRFRALDCSGNLLTVIFKNHGPLSGASQRHPHSQIIGLRVVPNYIRFLLEEAQRHFDSHGACVFCQITRHELEAGERMVWENERFIAYAPYASAQPYEVCLLPRDHAAHFGDLDDEAIHDLGECLHIVMRKLDRALSNPDYNIVYKNAPYALHRVPYFHWHLQIAPALYQPGGFELGSRVSVNVIPPEEAAAHLRSIEIKS